MWNHKNWFHVKSEWQKNSETTLYCVRLGLQFVSSTFENYFVNWIYFTQYDHELQFSEKNWFHSFFFFFFFVKKIWDWISVIFTLWELRWYPIFLTARRRWKNRRQQGKEGFWKKDFCGIRTFHWKCLRSRWWNSRDLFQSFGIWKWGLQSQPYSQGIKIIVWIFSYFYKKSISVA